jgi:hypothetical protein
MPRLAGHSAGFSLAAGTQAQSRSVTATAGRALQAAQSESLSRPPAAAAGPGLGDFVGPGGPESPPRPGRTLAGSDRHVTVSPPWLSNVAIMMAPEFKSLALLDTGILLAAQVPGRGLPSTTQAT